jgi:hypothetical protein
MVYKSLPCVVLVGSVIVCSSRPPSCLRSCSSEGPDAGAQYQRAGSGNPEPLGRTRNNTSSRLNACLLTGSTAMVHLPGPRTWYHA